MLYKIKNIFLVTLLILIFSVVHAQVTDKEITNIKDRIDAIEKTEQLHSVKYTIGRYASRTDLTLNQQKELISAMKLLAESFSERSHYRNAADVYKEYLDYKNQYLYRYNAFAKDSLIAMHKTVEQKELSTIASLESEIAALSKTRAAVSGLKSKYYSIGGFGAAGLIVLTLIIALSRNRAISAAEKQISSNREKIVSLNRQSAQSKMSEGTVSFCKDVALRNSQVITSVVEAVNLKDDNKIFQKEISILKQAQTELDSIGS